MKERAFELRVSADDRDVAYLRLPTFPVERPAFGVVKRSVRLCDVVGQYKGPDVILDFDEHDVLIGIEIVGNQSNRADDEDQ